MKTKLFTLLIALTASLGTIFAESGTCGTNLTWALTDGILTISGTGAMTNYSWGSKAPWYQSRSSIHEVVIDNGVTSLGNYAFDDCTGVKALTIGESVTNIGKPGFATCSNMTSVVWNAKHCADFSSLYTPFFYIDGDPAVAAETYDVASKITSFIFGYEVEYIPAYLCEYMTNVPEIVVPNCLTQIGSMAFLNCNYRVDGNYNITYPDTTLCYTEDLYIGGVKCDLQKSINYPTTWHCVLKTVEGCDSIITISVEWKRLYAPNSISSADCYDYPNTGSISYYFSVEPGRACDYYTLNGVKNASLDNLVAGDYRLVFHNIICEDSIVEIVQIKNGGMRINDMYYLLNDEDNTAVLTYRGESYSSYSNEYSGNITIPKTINFQDKTYQVTGINSSAFVGCNNIQSITIEAETLLAANNCGLPTGCSIFVPFGSLNVYKADSFWKNYNLHVMNPSHVTATTGATSVSVVFGNSEDRKHIASCGVDGGEQTAGYILDFIGLEPNSDYQNVPFYINTREGDRDIVPVSFTTSALELSTQPSKPVSSTIAILLAQTNMADVETSCGFEWKRHDAPEDMPGNKVFTPVANGMMAGRLKNLNENIYYKYRAFYQSATGNLYYGDWQYIFTGDVTVEFEPILYTYAVSAVTETTATLKGYALAGSDDFTEQGFEYWAESRVPHGDGSPSRMLAALGEHHIVNASGISMNVTLTDLDEGTVYRYRTYAKIGDQTIYGPEMTFTTLGEYTGSEDIETVSTTPDPRARKILRNGQILILRADRTYTLTGQEVK